jgi:hypothetical protein
LEHLLTREQLGIALFFVVPGLVMLRARGLFVNNRRQPLGDVVLSYVALSLFYQACIFPFSQMAEKLAGAWWVLAWVFGLFGVPAVIGFLLGLDAREGWSRKFIARFLNVNLGHPVDTAWDWRFAGCDECWVQAVLKDGTKWAGHLGGGSFMSTDPAERDLYIENVYSVGRGNVWKPKGSGVWLSSGEIRSIEFWPLKKEGDDDEGQGADQGADNGVRRARAAPVGPDGLSAYPATAERPPADHRTRRSRQAAKSGLRR